ncbi:carboxymuconolactone decarboxylase family protein [Brachybacterium sp. YJGR34]|uniref:carboxymuconolactone decarboxylase family protein n=1 Tax=Brachybacterium sp. YJGR34 TaxID=2059911 RepID=UPI000E0C8E34|nr:carboxymuconolactone decarboxylase family protein [Brachybacterium sp. YJGR34]
MSSLPFLDRSHPQAWQQLGQVAAGIGEAAGRAGVARSTTELMNLRISQLNGCAFCLHVHSRKALRAGVAQDRLAQLPVWRDSPSFDAVERAALLLGETLTLLPEPAVRDRDLMLARDVLGEEAFAVLEWAAILMNTYNRLSIASHHPVPDPS